jgi:hypothetical protein
MTAFLFAAFMAGAVFGALVARAIGLIDHHNWRSPVPHARRVIDAAYRLITHSIALGVLAGAALILLVLGQTDNALELGLLVVVLLQSRRIDNLGECVGGLVDVARIGAQLVEQHEVRR